MTLVPSSADGEERGTPLRFSFDVEHYDSAQLHVVACLVAHTVARSRGEERPVIITPFDGADRILGFARGTLVPKRRRRRSFERLPITTALLHALGSEADRVAIQWRPVRSTASMKLASALAGINPKPGAAQWWMELTYREIWRLAKDLGAAAEAEKESRN
ncbi:hypothetical protein [Streptomyces tubercidicus]|uniref:hypothetical protein n=1 Tax=Streptomyces tubercidicus TaxID=47759 RepID=UPI0036CE967E